MNNFIKRTISGVGFAAIMLAALLTNKFVYGAVMLFALVVMMYFMRSEFQQLFEIFRAELLLLVMGIVMAAGVIICVVSTYFVVGKLISLKKDELYY